MTYRFKHERRQRTRLRFINLPEITILKYFFSVLLLRLASVSNSVWCVYRVFGFVARKSGSAAGNACHVFAEVDPNQPANAIVNFLTKVMIGQGHFMKTWGSEGRLIVTWHKLGQSLTAVWLANSWLIMNGQKFRSFVKSDDRWKCSAIWPKALDYSMLPSCNVFVFLLTSRSWRCWPNNCSGPTPNGTKPCLRLVKVVLAKMSVLQFSRMSQALNRLSTMQSWIDLSQCQGKFDCSLRRMALQKGENRVKSSWENPVHRGQDGARSARHVSNISISHRLALSNIFLITFSCCILHIVLTLWRPLLSYGCCYKASCTRPG